MARIVETCNHETAPGSNEKGGLLMRIRNLSIQDFRGFRRFEMEGLGRINLIVGTNNSGKTTVLEAINLLAARGDTPDIWSMLLQRGEASGAERSTMDSGSSRPIQIWRLFRGYDVEVGATFRIEGISDSGLVATTATIEEYDPTDSQALGVKFPPVEPFRRGLPAPPGSDPLVGFPIRRNRTLDSPAWARRHVVVGDPSQLPSRCPRFSTPFPDDFFTDGGYGHLDE